MADQKQRTTASRVREAAAKLGQFSPAELVRFDYGCFIAPERVRGVLRDLRKSGEVERIETGVYLYTAKKKARTLLDVVWHLVRSHRQFSTDEIERLSGAARATVLEYLHCLRRLGFLRQARRGSWQLISDPGPDTPTNTTKCQRLRRLREKHAGAE